MFGNPSQNLELIMSQIRSRPMDGGAASERRRQHNLGIPTPTPTAAGGRAGESKNRSATNQRNKNRPSGRGNR